MAGQPTYDDLVQRIRVLEDENSKLQQAEKVLAGRVEKLNKPLRNDQHVVFEELFSLDDIQRLQDDFAKATGVASIITDLDGTPITTPSNFCRLCTDFIRKSEKGLANCHKSDAFIGRLHAKGPTIQRCLSAGLWDAGAGITVGGRHIANWLVGQVRDTDQTEDRIREYAREIGAGEDEMVEAFLEVPCMCYEQFEKVAKLLFTTATQLSRIAYQNLEQERFIADFKRAEYALKERKKEYRVTLDNLVVGVVVHANDTSILFSNQEAINILGLGYSQMFSKEESDPGWSFVHEDLSIMAFEDYPVNKVLSTKMPVRDSVVGVRRPDRKDLAWVIVNAVPLMSGDGEIKKIIVNFFDFTDRKLAEEMLQRNEALLNTTQHLAKIGGWEVSLDTQSVFWTDEVYRIHDLQPDMLKSTGEVELYQAGDNILGKYTSVDETAKLSLQCYAPEDRLVVHEAFLKCVEEGHPYDLEFPFTTAKGRKLWIRTIANPVMKDGRIVRIVGNLMDITAQKRAENEKQRLEAQLHQAVKVEALGTLAGGIAHDFNNILSAILGHGQMALDELSSASNAYEDIKQVIASGNRAADLVKRILLFSRQEEEDYHAMHLQDAVEEVVGMFSATLPSSIKLSHSIDWDCGAIHANSTQIHQVILNLLTNARQAIQDDYGSISLSLSDTLPSPSLFSVQSSDKVTQRYACIEICDSGCGIPKELQAKVFDPFFTTKSENKGTGLGLAVVDGIVRKHRGIVTFESGVKGGTVFQVYLPVIESVHAAALPEKESIAKGCERILLIDDEWTLVSLHKRFLEKCGYEVTGFSDSLEALKSFQQNSDSYDIVVTDMTMPTLTGLDLIREIMQMKPGMPSILCTGYSESVTEEMALSVGVRDYLFKPFSPLFLAKTIRKVFDNA